MSEAWEGGGDEAGCPEADMDGNGMDCEVDGCPAQPEDLDGFEDEDGCPEGGGPPAAEPETPRHRRGR